MAVASSPVPAATLTADVPQLITARGSEAVRDLDGALTHAHGVALHLEPARRDDRRHTKVRKLLKAALKANAAGDPRESARLALDALGLDDANAAACHVMAAALEQLGHVSRALQFYERAWTLNPRDPQIYLAMGLAAWKLDMMAAAEKFFRLALQMEPANVPARVNLGGVLRDDGRFEDAIEILREGLYAAPGEAQLWNAIGTVMLHSGDIPNARTFYEETLRLDADFARGWHNLAYALNTAGDGEGALEASDKALECGPRSAKDAYEIAHSRALSLLTLGRLEDAWRAYEVRLDVEQGPMVFQAPGQRLDPFDPKPLTGRAVLVIGEQGVGDEVLHFNALADLEREIGADGRMIVACEPRLAPLLARSFPRAQIERHATVSREARKVRAVAWADAATDGHRQEQAPAPQLDVWTPAAGLLARYRRRLDAFPNTAFLTPDPQRVAGFRAQLAALGPEPKVGLCWKSKKMTASRRKYFSPFEAWRPVLETAGVTFVSMQYGDVDSEIAQAAQDYGVTIHQLTGLDLMDDLDGVAAAGAALDLTIGPMNASTNLAGAAGGLIWIVALRTHWPLFSTDRLHFYPDARAFSPPMNGDWNDAMAQIAAALRSFTQTQGAA